MRQLTGMSESYPISFLFWGHCACLGAVYMCMYVYTCTFKSCVCVHASHVCEHALKPEVDDECLP